MVIFRMFFEIARGISQDCSTLVSESLEGIATFYVPYAYIGSRKTLEQFVLKSAERLVRPYLDDGNSSSTSSKALDSLEIENKVEWWYGTKQWKKDSGAFPDFVLACDLEETYGNGTIIELKDSKSGSMASFNSTIPSARKSIDTLAEMVCSAIQRYESASGQVCSSRERDCFYLIRTHRGNHEKCRLSLVQGTFFETISTSDLLTSLWGHLLEQANVPDESKRELLNSLSRLTREEIALSRHIEGASVKPRLRIMCEVISDGNPHDYSEIPPCTVNLIVKIGNENDIIGNLIRWLEKDHLQLENVSKDQIRVYFENDKFLLCQVKTIQHKQNGLHLFLQVSPSIQPQSSV